MKTECKASSSEEPGAGIPHAGICAGGARQRASLPRYVTEYLSADGSLAAHYEYSPFGEIVVQSGDFADTFTHRFSTKPWCGVTGLSEYEMRKYSPSLGRWMSRDPIGEEGGDSLYCFAANQTIASVDYLGLSPGLGCCSYEAIYVELELFMKAAVNATRNNVVRDNTDVWSIKYYREFAGYICCNKKTGQVRGVGPKPGTWRYEVGHQVFFTEEPWKQMACPTSANVFEELSCDPGFAPVMFYHSHPSGGGGLSPGDIGTSDAFGMPIAMGSPDTDGIVIYVPGPDGGDMWVDVSL